LTQCRFNSTDESNEERIARRSNIPRNEENSDSKTLNEDLTDSSLGLDDDDDDDDETTEVNKESSASAVVEKTGSQRGQLIRDALGDIGQAAHAVNVERKSDIIHSLPKTSEDTASGDSSGSAEIPKAKADVTPSVRRTNTIKNLFNALGDSDTETSGAKSQQQDADKRSKTVNILFMITLCKLLHCKVCFTIEI
jgi:hypothetical protein